MAHPYQTESSQAFQPVRKFATTDPKLLTRESIDASLADKWCQLLLPQPLQDATKLVTTQIFGLNLLPNLADNFCWLSKAGDSSAECAFILHDFTGRLWGSEMLAQV